MIGEKRGTSHVDWRRAADGEHVASAWPDDLRVREIIGGFAPIISLEDVTLFHQDSLAAAQAAAERAREAIAAMVEVVVRVDAVEYGKASGIDLELCCRGRHSDCPGEFREEFAIPCDCACHVRPMFERLRAKVAELEERCGLRETEAKAVQRRPDYMLGRAPRAEEVEE